MPPPPALTVPAPRTPLPPWWWLTGTGTAVVTFLLCVPAGARRHGRVDESLVPDERWTVTDVRSALRELGVPEPLYAGAVHAVGQLVTVSFLTVAVLIGRRRPGDRGPLVVSLLLAVSGWALSGTHSTLATLLPFAAEALQRFGVAAFGGLTVLLLVFPDGRFRPRWTWVVAVVGVTCAALGVTGPVAAGADVLLVGTALLAQVRRYRHADPVGRQQTKWVVWSLSLVAAGGTALFASTTAFPAWTAPGPGGLVVSTVGNVLLVLLVLLVPLAVGAATTRYRLWDVDALINRTLLWGALTLTSTLVYLGVVAVVDATLRAPAGSPAVPAVVAALVVVALVAPTRRAAQRALNRWTFGDRDVPQVVLARLTARTAQAGSAQEALRAAATTLATALRLPATHLELLDRHGSPLLGSGPALPSSAAETTLVARGEAVGRLALAPRRGDVVLGARDRHLLDVVAPHLATLALALRSTEELRLAHRRLVTSAQEERRRMRRRLHDEVGPGLATAAMDLDVALTVLGSDPATARRLLEGVRATITDDVALVRGLAYRLYPPEVEQLGLAGAVEDVAQQHLTGADVDVDVRVGAPLGAAVEVAVYRIAAEALRNAGRHARAGRVRVRVVDGPGEVLLEVSDDGCGTAGSRPGAGLLGMRERAEELGGELQVVSPPGTTVRARLPLAPEVRP